MLIGGLIPGRLPGKTKGALIAFWVCQVIFAGVHDEKLLARMDKSGIYLYDHSNHERHYIPADPGSLLPHRVHVVYDKELHQWCYTKTDLSGRLVKPTEYLRSDTITSGKVIGAPLALQRFRLGESGNWGPTRDSEIYRVWVKTSPAQTRAFVYRSGKNSRSSKPQLPALRVPTEVPQRSQQ